MDVTNQLLHLTLIKNKDSNSSNIANGMTSSITNVNSMNSLNNFAVSRHDSLQSNNCFSNRGSIKTEEQKTNILNSLNSLKNHQIRTHKLSFANSLNQNNLNKNNFSTFEINLVENVNKVNINGTPSFKPTKNENEIQIKLVVLKEEWKKKKRIL